METEQLDNHAKFWSSDKNAEVYDCTSEDECIKEFLRNTEFKYWPEMLTIYGLELNHPKVEDYVESLAHDFVEELDDEFGGDTSVTPKILDASKIFVATVLEDYKPYWGEIKEEKTIDLKKWIIGLLEKVAF